MFYFYKAQPQESKCTMHTKIKSLNPDWLLICVRARRNLNLCDYLVTDGWTRQWSSSPEYLQILKDKTFTVCRAADWRIKENIVKLLLYLKSSRCRTIGRWRLKIRFYINEIRKLVNEMINMLVPLSRTGERKSFFQ